MKEKTDLTKVLGTASAFAKSTASAVKEKSGVAIEKSKELAQKGADTVKTATEVAYKKTVAVLDENGNGEVDIEDVILKAMKVPGVRIRREKFLTKEFVKVCDPETLRVVIEKNPVSAGISTVIIDTLAEDTIKFERNCVSGISAALGIPGGAAMIATIPADIAQYYGYMLRTAQKLMYIYGFPEIIVEDNETQLDTATINTLTICLGVMYGVAGASNALKAMAKALSEGVSKQLMKKALTKGAIYPVVKSVAKWFNVKMTKEVFAGFFKKSIPVVGGVVGAGITYATFKPCCDRLRESLKNTALNNPNINDIEDATISFTEE